MKKLILFMMAIMFSLAINAQTTSQQSKLFDNTYIGIIGGCIHKFGFYLFYTI